MSRLDDIIQGIKEQGLIQDEELILQLAKDKLHYEKIKNIPDAVVGILKKKLRNRNAS